MSCNRCGCGFSLFKKENYCRNCGFAFCSGCLSKKIHIPKLVSDSKHSVCHKCFGILTRAKPEVNANSTVRSASPPAALQRRMEALPQLNNVHYPTNFANGSSKNEASYVDKQIADRLAGLRADSNPPVQVQTLPQLEERLARLKGLPSASTVAATAQSNSRPPVTYQQPDTRTYDEQIQDLLQQFTQRVDLDARTPKPEDEIAARLARLRSDDASMNDLNKSTANPEPPPPATVQPPPAPTTTRMPPIGDSGSDDDEMSRVYQYMLEAEQESRREAEEALTLQARDAELKKKLEEIRANRDTPKRRRVGSGPLASDLSDEDNEDKIADKVIKQFLSESMLDSAVGAIPSHQSSKHKSSKRHKEEKLLNFKQPSEPDEVEELPWCVICNEDASLRCYGCEGDLYCRRCFRECHTGQDLRDHKMGPFNSKTDLNHRTASYIDS